MSAISTDTFDAATAKRISRPIRAFGASLLEPAALRLAALTLAGLLFAALPGSPQAAENQDAGTFLMDLNERVVAELAAPDLAPAERQRRFRALFEECFNLPSLGRFVLGRYWRGASQEERALFLAVFEDVLVHRFSPLFAEYTGADLAVVQVRADSDDSDSVTVSTEVRRPQGQTFAIDWRLRRSEGRYQIVDVVAEGVSIAITLRSEFGALILRNGGQVEALSAQLRDELAAASAAPASPELAAVTTQN